MFIPHEWLPNRFEEYTRRNDMLTHLQGASLFKYIYENFSPETPTQPAGIPYC